MILVILGTFCFEFVYASQLHLRSTICDTHVIIRSQPDGPDLRIHPTLVPHDTEVNLGSIANGRIESRLDLEAGSALQVRGASSRQETLRLQHQSCSFH